MSEIVADIVRDMRDGNFGCAKCGDSCDCPRTDEIIAKFADRIEAAYKRDIQTMVDAGVEDMQTAMDEATKLREENERLKAALKPVLECPACADFSAMKQASFCMNAVADAIHIYNRGAK